VPIHGQQVGEVLEVGPPIGVVEEVVLGRQGAQFVAEHAQGVLYQAHVEVAGVVAGDDEVAVGRDVALTFDLHVEQLVVGESLGQTEQGLAGLGDGPGHLQGLVLSEADLFHSLDLGAPIPQGQAGDVVDVLPRCSSLLE
jgi:hypothetical protein